MGGIFLYIIEKVIGEVSKDALSAGRILGGIIRQKPRVNQDSSLDLWFPFYREISAECADTLPSASCLLKPEYASIEVILVHIFLRTGVVKVCSKSG